MMRRFALMAAALALPPAQAYAQAAVFCSNCTEEITAQINYVAVAAKWVQQAAQMEQQYQQLLLTVESLRHLNPQSLEVAAGLLSNAQHLPGSAAAVIPGMNFGAHLSGAGTPFYNQNHYATPTGDDFAAKEMERQQIATANLQGEAQTVITAIGERLAGLTELQASIPEQHDVTAVAAMTARTSSEQAFLANETNHVASLQLLQQTQMQVDMQRAAQHGRQLDEEALHAWGG
jgi:hypothetical protein